MAEALAGGFASFVGGAINEALFEGPARRQYNADMERYSDERFKREKAQVDALNADREEARAHLLGAKKGVAYRTSVAQMADARRQEQHFLLLSQDFLKEVGAKKALQVVEYAGSGALVKGSALVRLRETKQRGDIGAERLRKAANIALRRGSKQAQFTRESVIQPMFVPYPDPIKQPNVPRRSTFSPLGAFWGGFGSGIQEDYAKGNWPFGGGGGGGFTSGFVAGSGTTRDDPWGVAGRQDYY